MFAGLAAVALRQLVGLAFAGPPQVASSSHAEQQAAAGAALAGAAVLTPQVAFAAELRDDGFGPVEIVALLVPFVFVVLAYLEWESKQEPTDSVTGVGTLGKQVDGPGEGQYFRRSPESG